MAASDYVDQAVATLGGEDTDFILTARMAQVGAPGPYIHIDCRIEGCGWGFTIGQMELWEFITDAREHWETTHATAGQPQDTT